MLLRLRTRLGPRQVGVQVEGQLLEGQRCRGLRRAGTAKGLPDWRCVTVNAGMNVGTRNRVTLCQ